MLSPSAVTWLFRFGLAGCLLTLSSYAVLILAIMFPGPAFDVERSGGRVTFHANTPIPDHVTELGEEITAAFDALVLPLPAQGVDVWLVDEGWRAHLFFAGSPRASGLTYPVASSRNVFLRHADLASNRLIRSGRPVPPPRTLTYFLVHEITHLAVAEYAGQVAITRIPRWVNEGLADFVALGPATPGMVRRAAVGAPLPRDVFGTYPSERICVTLALARLGGNLDALLALRDDLGPDGSCPLVAEFGIAPREGGT